MGDERDFNERRRETLSVAAPAADRPHAAPPEHRRQFSALNERRPASGHPGTKSRTQPIVQQPFNNGSRNRTPIDEEKLDKIAQQQQEEAEKQLSKLKQAANTVMVVNAAKTGLTDDTPAPVKAKFIKRRKDIAS